MERPLLNIDLGELERYETLSVRGDTPGAAAIARAVREALDGLSAEERV